MLQVRLAREFRVASLMTSSGLYGDTLKYAAITLDLALDSQDMEYSVGHQYQQRWDQLVADLRKVSPRPLTSIFHATPQDSLWSWLAAQKVSGFDLLDELSIQT